MQAITVQLRSALAAPGRTTAYTLPLLVAVAFSGTAAGDPIVDAQNGLTCAGSRYGSVLNCNAGEFTTVVNITPAPGSPLTCTAGEPLTLVGQIGLSGSKANRYNIGFFTGEDGNDPQQLGGQCSVATFPASPLPWDDYDGNSCGDFEKEGVSTPTVQNIRVLCSGNASGELLVPYTVVYEQNASVCTGPGDVSSGSPSKCNAGVATITGILVTPSLTNSDGVDAVSPTDTTTYDVVIENTTGFTLSNAVFAAPAVADLSVTNLACSASGGASCPAVSIAAMEGSGITIPDMPAGGSVTFSITATVAPSADGSVTYIANLTAGPAGNRQTISASDTDTIFIPAAQLVTHYTMDQNGWDGTAGEVLDDTGNDHHATATDDANTADADPALSGSPGTCRYGDFDGSGDYLQDADAELYLEGLYAITVTAWVKSEESDYDGGIFSGVAKGDSDTDLGLRYDEDGWGGGGTNVIKASIRTTAGDTQIETISHQQTTDWQHLAFVWRSGQSIRVFVNGSEVASSYDQGALGGVIDGIDFLAIGHGTKGEDWEGFIDEFRVYDQALTAAEIATVMNETRPCPAPPAAQGCAAVFPSPLQNSDLAGQITFGWDAQALSDPDGALETDTLNFNAWGDSTCGTADCTASGMASTPPTLPTFPTNTSTTDVATSWLGGTVTLGQGGVTEYRTITLQGLGANLIDGGAATEYRVKTLNVNWATNDITLQGGTDYYVETLNLNDSVDINVAGTGTARLFVRNAVTGSWGSELNPGGTPDRLLLVTYGALAWNTGSGSDFNALVYSEGNITIGSDMTLTGALASPGTVVLGSETRITYDSAPVEDVDHRGLCGPVPGALDHFAITHDDYGINCVDETITVEAMDGLGEVVTDYAGTITLDTGSGKGTWSLANGNGTLTDATANDGIATYAFAAADNGTASFSLAYREGVASINISVDDGTAQDDDTEGNLVFSPSGFTVTASILNDPATDLPDPVGTQTAGTAFPLHISAYGQTASDPTCGIIETYTGGKNLKFWSEYDTPNSGTLQVAVDGADIATSEAGAALQAVAFTDGKAQVTANYPDVGRIAIYMKDDSPADPNLPTGIRGASDPFVVKPAGFVVSNVIRPTTPGDCSAGTSLAWTGPIGSDTVIGAGHAFCATVTAVNSGGAATPNYGAEGEGVALAVSLSGNCTGCTAVPALTNGTIAAGSFSGGSATVSNLAWSEVGIIDLTPSVDDGDYLGAGDVTGTATGDIGRFVPDHLQLTVTEDGTLNNANTSGAIEFTYSGQTITGYAVAPEVVIYPRNSGGTTTANYQGSFARLSPGNETVTHPAADNSALDALGAPYPVSAIPGANSLAPLDPTHAAYQAGAFGLTIGNATQDSYTYTRSNGQVVPFTPDLTLTVSVTDLDGVVDNGDATPNPTGSGEIRYGRGVVHDVYGTFGNVNDVLTLWPTAEYYSAPNTWSFNTDDSDSAFGYTLDTSGTIDLTSAPPATIALHAGLAGLSLTVSGDTGAPGGRAAVDFDWPAWLPGPDALATFGIFRSDDRFLYWQEQ